MRKIKSHPLAELFLEPVDPIRDEAPDSFKTIKKPMDLSTVQTKLNKKMYKNVQEWKDDMTLISSNAIQYNGRKNYVGQVGVEFQKIFKELSKTVSDGIIMNWYNELLETRLPEVMVIGFTSDMAGYMKASDLFVTKPGGLSSTEAAVCGVPMIHVAAIPGCETYNARFFSDSGMSIFCQTSEHELAEALKTLENDTAREEMVRKQRELISPDASARIVTLAERMAATSRKLSAADRGSTVGAEAVQER